MKDFLRDKIKYCNPFSNFIIALRLLAFYNSTEMAVNYSNFPQKLKKSSKQFKHLVIKP